MYRNAYTGAIKGPIYHLLCTTLLTASVYHLYMRYHLLAVLYLIMAHNQECGVHIQINRLETILFFYFLTSAMLHKC